MADKSLTDQIAEAVADVEAGPEVEPKWVRHREQSSGPTAVNSVRVPVDRLEELRELAAARGVQPTVLIRSWVLAQLDAAKEADDYAQRWERDVQAAVEHLQNLLRARPGGPLADAS